MIELVQVLSLLAVPAAVLCCARFLNRRDADTAVDAPANVQVP